MDTHIEHLEQAQRPPAPPRDGGRRPPTRGKLILRLSIMAVICIVVFGGFYGYEKFREAKIAEFFAGMKPPPVPVNAATAVSTTMPRYLPGIGSLTAVHQVQVSPEIGGRVTKIFFTPGAQVHAGDPLVQLNDQPEQGDLSNFQALARLAQINVTRAKELASRQNGPIANVDTFQSQLDQANASIAKTQALIAQKLIRAPFDGVLGVRQVDLGQFVTAGSVVVTLTDLDTLYVNFTLPEQNRAALAIGQQVQVTADAYPGKPFTAQLTTIEPQVSADTRAIKLQATLANADHRLLPGMFANARVVLPPQANVVTVPETAVDYTLYGDSVFVIRQDGADAGKPVFKVKRSFVKTGERLDGNVAIVSGLAAGDRIVTTGQLKLIDDAVVQPDETPGLVTPATIPKN
ncbi:MAG: efflux transporter periplasmic adaptor subunit [Rhodospirillales bacterium]|nr:efflux transporter periplasmic adaptor subunit [Rhodospirillales bacterium]